MLFAANAILSQLRRRGMAKSAAPLVNEVFETLPLIQTAKISRFPLVALGREYWENLLDFVKDSMLAEHTLDNEELKSVYVTGASLDAVEYIWNISRYSLSAACVQVVLARAGHYRTSGMGEGVY